MEVSTHRHAGVEAGGVRAALKKLSFRGLNGWSSSKSSLDELDENRYVNSNGHCCHDVTTGINSDGGSNSSAADVASLTPITDVDTLAMLAAMDEANRRLEADVRTRSPRQMTKQHSEASSGDRYLSRQESTGSCLSNNSTSSEGDMFNASTPEELWDMWKMITDDVENFEKRRPHLKELVRKGIPFDFRGKAWYLLSGAHESPLKDSYSEYLSMNSPHEKYIRRDVCRTYPEHEMFQTKDGAGQESLFNVIKAYSVYDAEVGYCQGIGFIAGLLLMNMPEKDAFVILIRIMEEYQMRDLYKPLMAQLGMVMYQFESMIKEKNLDLYRHFQNQEFCVTLFASSWFLTLFSLTLPLTVACRVVDIFLSEGISVIFRVALGLLQLCEEDLLATDMEGMLKLLQKDLPARLEVDPEPLFTKVFTLKYSARKMARYEKEYTTKRPKETVNGVEILKIKTENHLLRQRLDYLEQDSDRPLDATAQCLSTTYTDCTKIKQMMKAMEEMRNREVKANTMIAELKGRVRELEAANQQLTHEPNIDVETLQEQLISCKLREAEATMLTKELERRVVELDKHFQRYGEISGSPDGRGKANKAKLQEINDELMMAQIREASAATELAEMKQQITELETAKHISDRQVKRLVAENERLTEKEEEWKAKEKELESRIRVLERQLSDVESRAKEEAMMSRIRNAETAQTFAEMTQRIAELEIQNQELLTADQLHVSRCSDVEPRAIDSKIADLEEEILQLKLLRKSSSADDTLSDDDSDFDLDDDDVGRLRLDDSVAMTTSSLYDDSSAVRLDLPDGSELPGYLDVSAVSTDVPDCHVLPDDIEIPGTGDVSASSGDVPGSDRSPGAASEVLGNGDVPAVSSDIPGENDVIIDSNCWFVANCDDDYDEPLNVNVTPASFGGLTESVSGMNPTVLPLYSSN